MKLSTRWTRQDVGAHGRDPLTQSEILGRIGEMIFHYEGKKIRFEITGNGPPILFLHGLGGNMNNWMLQRDYFSKTHRVVTLDLPGHGQSEGRDVAFKEYWRVIKALLAHLDIRSCTMCGLSKGARVAIGVASRAPSLVARLIIVNAFVDLTLSDRETRISLYDLLGRDDGGRLWAENILVEMGIQNNSAIARGFLKSLRQIDPHHIQSLFAELIAYDQRGELSAIQCPTLIVRGSNDNFVPEYCSLELHSLIAGSELIQLDGCGHLPYLENPALFNRIVEEFIRTE